MGTKHLKYLGYSTITQIVENLDRRKAECMQLLDMDEMDKYSKQYIEKAIENISKAEFDLINCRKRFEGKPISGEGINESLR